MPTSEDRSRHARQRADDARARGQEVQARTVEVVRAAAATEDSIAATMDQLAGQRPQHADRLRALGQAARDQAAYQRQWISQHGATTDGSAPGEPPGPDGGGSRTPSN